MRQPGTTGSQPVPTGRGKEESLRTLRANGTGIQKAKVPLQSVHIAPSEHALLLDMQVIGCEIEPVNRENIRRPYALGTPRGRRPHLNDQLLLAGAFAAPF